MSEQTTEVVSIPIDTVRLLIGMSDAAIVRRVELDAMLVDKIDFRVFYDNFNAPLAEAHDRLDALREAIEELLP